MAKSFLLKICLMLISLVFVPAGHAYGFTYSQSENVSASIGAFYLNISGYIAPNASVVFVADNVALRTAVADQNGYFYITGVLVNKGLTSFCLDAIDFKRLGESYTCFQIPALESNIDMKDIFLPPTLGLQRTEITAGQEAVVWGYSMPGAQVAIHGSDGKTYEVTADNTGYYEFKFKITVSGKYELFADAVFQNKKSKEPDKKVALSVLSTAQNIIKQGQNAANNFWQFLLGSPWGILLILIPFITAIVVLFKKLKPDQFTFIEINIYNLFSGRVFKQKKLHHAWFVGY